MTTSSPKSQASSPVCATVEPTHGVTEYGGCCRGCGEAIPVFGASVGGRKRIVEYRAMLARQGWDLGRGLCPACAAGRREGGG